MTFKPPALTRSRWRLPEQGLIKFGTTQKAKKRDGGTYDQPVAIPWFRFCSSDRHALEQLARCSCGHPDRTHADAIKGSKGTGGGCLDCADCTGFDGGEVLPWKNGFGRDAWQVTTLKSRIRVALPEDPISDPQYELFGGTIRVRICDGETCTLPRGSKDQRGRPREEPDEVPCLCATEGKLSCKPTTRLKVILPELDPLIGVWRMDCKGKHAADELPGMVELVLGLQGRGLAHAWLDLVERSEYGWNERKKAMELHHYVTPHIAPAASFDQLLQGGGRVRAGLPGGGPLALGPGTLGGARGGPSVGSFDPGPEADPYVAAGFEVTPEGNAYGEDDIVDAEVVEDGMTAFDREDQEWEAEQAMKDMRSAIAMVFKDGDVRHALADRYSDGRTATTTELTLAELTELRALAHDVKDGRAKVELVDGQVKVLRRGRRP